MNELRWTKVVIWAPLYSLDLHVSKKVSFTVQHSYLEWSKVVKLWEAESEIYVIENIPIMTWLGPDQQFSTLHLMRCINGIKWLLQGLSAAATAQELFLWRLERSGRKKPSACWGSTTKRALNFILNFSNLPQDIIVGDKMWIMVMIKIIELLYPT